MEYEEKEARSVAKSEEETSYQFKGARSEVETKRVRRRHAGVQIV